MDHFNGSGGGQGPGVVATAGFAGEKQNDGAQPFATGAETVKHSIEKRLRDSAAAGDKIILNRNFDGASDLGAAIVQEVNGIVGKI